MSLNEYLQTKALASLHVDGSVIVGGVKLIIYEPKSHPPQIELTLNTGGVAVTIGCEDVEHHELSVRYLFCTVQLSSRYVYGE